MDTSLSRESFIKASLATGAGLGLAGALSHTQANADEATGAFENTVDWSAEYDVVVLGVGEAGMVTAISAADKGARVLIVEKCPVQTAGGNTRVCCGGNLTVLPENRDMALVYLKQVVGNYDSPSDEMLEAYVDHCVTNPQWNRDHGINDQPIMESGGGAYKDFEGWEATGNHMVDTEMYTASRYNATIGHIRSRDDIDVWYDSPAVHLIQDPVTKIVHGVTVNHEGEGHNVRALDGVVICTGGFEANQQMIQDYLRLPEGYPHGSTANTGDGIRMAQEIGADLWHMCNTAGPDMDVVNTAIGQAYNGGALRVRGTHNAPLESSGYTSGSCIMVGADGTRFCSETLEPDHGYEDFHGAKVICPIPLPVYMVFDSVQYEIPVYPVWVNDEKVEEGVIVKADTLDELTEKLGLPAGSLVQTVADYNEACANGVDAFYGRDPEYMTPLLEKGPYYACELKPSFVNTMGGPRRNARAEILDVAGNPIPHLYGAGECGSMWSGIYPGGGNVSECIAYGRIAGENAAAPKDDNLRESVMDDKTPVDFTIELPTFEPEAGNEFIGMDEGIGGAIWVKVTVDGNAISDVEVIYNAETPEIGTRAVAVMPERILEAQSVLDVDILAGATTTSEAILEAAGHALVDAGLLDASALPLPKKNNVAQMMANYQARLEAEGIATEDFALASE